MFTQKFVLKDLSVIILSVFKLYKILEIEWDTLNSIINSDKYKGYKAYNLSTKEYEFTSGFDYDSGCLVYLAQNLEDAKHLNEIEINPILGKRMMDLYDFDDNLIGFVVECPLNK